MSSELKNTLNSWLKAILIGLAIPVAFGMFFHHAMRTQLKSIIVEAIIEAKQENPHVQK